MSDLVEKVRKAIYGANSGGVGEMEARAAIKAVAEWIDEHHQIDKDGSVNLAMTWQ